MPAQSITCVKDYGGENSCVNNQDTAGDCAILGYSTENVKDCAQYLRCPFNSDYKICVSGATSSSIDCATLGFTQDDKSTWCAPDKIIKCPTNESLTLCNGVNTEVMDCASLGFTSSDKTETCPAEKIVTCPTDSSLTICTEPGAKPINCAELGFTQDDKSEICLAEKIIKCPTDETYTLCSEPNDKPLDCAAIGFTTSDKSAWCDNIVGCPTDETYTLCSETGSCSAKSYSDLVKLLGNDVCTVVTLKNDIDATSDTNATSLSLADNQILDGKGKSIKLYNQSLVLNNSSKLKNINLEWNYAPEISIYAQGSNSAISDLNINIAATRTPSGSSDHYKLFKITDHISISGTNKITLKGENILPAYYTLLWVGGSSRVTFTLEDNADLDVDINNISSAPFVIYAASKYHTFNLNGNIDIDIQNTGKYCSAFDIGNYTSNFISNGDISINIKDSYCVAFEFPGASFYDTIMAQFNGFLDITLDNASYALTSSSRYGRIQINGDANIEAKNSTNTLMINYGIDLAGSLHIIKTNVTGPFYSSESSSGYNGIFFSSPTAKLTTTATDMAYSETDVGIHSKTGCVKGAKWILNSSGYNKTWTCSTTTELKTDTEYLKYPSSSYWR